MGSKRTPKTCLNCRYCVIRKATTMKHPTIKCRMGIQRDIHNHEKRFVLSGKEYGVWGYDIVWRKEFELAKKCAVFESMDEDGK